MHLTVYDLNYKLVAVEYGFFTPFVQSNISTLLSQCKHDAAHEYRACREEDGPATCRAPSMLLSSFIKEKSLFIKLMISLISFIPIILDFTEGLITDVTTHSRILLSTLYLPP